jgi:hypothetical protein
MRSRRTITATTACLLTFCLSAVLPVAATASSLLSGYGGPGQGSQAIIGAGLVNGGGRGGGSRGGGSGGGSSSAAGSSTAAGSAAVATSDAGTGTTPGVVKSQRPKPGKHGAKAKRAAPVKGQVGSVSAGGTKAYPALSTSAAVHGAPAGGTLGLSGANLLYMVLALGVLILTGLLTRRLVGGAGQVGTGS